MTVKKCAKCSKWCNLPMEMDVRDNAHYHGKFYHPECFLSMQGAVHRANDPADTCPIGRCNADLFSPARWYSGLALAAAAAGRLPTYLHLAVVLYYSMLLAVLLDPLYFNLAYGVLGVLCIAAFRGNPGKMLAFAAGYAYVRYYCSAAVADAHLHDVLLIAKLTLLLWLIERGARTFLLLRVVDPAQWARESGALMWTCHAWPVNAAVPLYASLIGGAAVCGAVYAAIGVLLPIFVWVAAIGAVSFGVLIYPPRVVPRWRMHVEGLLSLPF